MRGKARLRAMLTAGVLALGLGLAGTSGIASAGETPQETSGSVQAAAPAPVAGRIKLTDFLIMQYGSRDKVPHEKWVAAQKGPESVPTKADDGPTTLLSDCDEGGSWLGACLWDGWGGAGYMVRFPYSTSCGYFHNLSYVWGPPTGVNWNDRVDYFQNHSVGDLEFDEYTGGVWLVKGGVGEWSLGNVPSWLVNTMSGFAYYC